MEKRLIIAERIRLKYAGEVADFIGLLIVTIGLLVWFINLESTIAIVICSMCIAAIIGWFIFDIVKIYNNNHLSNIIITLKNDKFTIHDPVENFEFIKSDFIDMNYKNKKFSIVTPYYYSSGEYNYGTLTLYLKDKDSTKECFKLTLKNVANPNKVFDKLYHILEWDVVDE